MKDRITIMNEARHGHRHHIAGTNHSRLPPSERKRSQRFRVLELQERTNERVIRLIVTKARAGSCPARHVHHGCGKKMRNVRLAPAA